MEKAIRFAILTTVVPRPVRGTRLRRPHYTFRQIAAESEKLGITTILVHPDRYGSRAGSIAGWVGKKLGTEQENWVLETVPLPQVAYDNLFVHLVMQGKARKFRRLCAARGIPLFNPGVPNKYTVNRIMSRSQTVSKFIPETKEAVLTRDVLQMLESYKVIYLKPTGGYGGRGVTRITKQSENSFLVQYDRLGDKFAKMNRQMDRNDFQKWIRQKIRRQRHIVQQGLNLIRVNGGQVDFRVVLHRGKTGEWSMIGIIPKIAAPGRVVTNLVAGGTKTTMDWLADWCKQHNVTLSADELEKAALQIANFWSNRTPNLGLVGFDMGIDTQGRVWLIEINPKPARSLLAKHMLPACYRSIAGFAYYLANRKK